MDPGVPRASRVGTSRADPRRRRPGQPRLLPARRRPWLWVDRLGWSDEQWQDWVDQPGHELWTLRSRGTAGYFELVPDGPGDVLLAYFGLVPGFEGRGLGGWLLTAALRRAWELPGTTRVWVHTCDLDGPAALPNYRARGMRGCGRGPSTGSPTAAG